MGNNVRELAELLISTITNEFGERGWLDDEAIEHTMPSSHERLLETVMNILREERMQ